MKPELDKLCQEYIAGRDAVKSAFRWDNDALHAVCANLFCACGKAADTERLKECRKIIKAHTGFRSRFRSRIIRNLAKRSIFVYNYLYKVLPVTGLISSSSS